MMNNAFHPASPPANEAVPSPLPRTLLTPQEVRRRLTAKNPAYGRDFSEADWSQIAARLPALARLLWRISCREKVAPEQRRPTTGADHPLLRQHQLNGTGARRSNQDPVAPAQQRQQH